MIINATAVWVGVAMSWAAVVWFDGSLTWVWIAFILPSPIAAVLIRRAFQRRLAYTRETLAARPPISPLT
jgi:membrane protein implicated in regulation of membrane protease activity